MSCGRGCLAGFEPFKTSFSLKNVAARLDSTRLVSLCQAINKNLKECDRPARLHVRLDTAGLYVLTNGRVFSLGRVTRGKMLRSVYWKVSVGAAGDMF